MSEPTLTIRELRLRVPGLGRAEAQRLGEAVARELASQPPMSAAPRALDHLAVRVHGTSAQGVPQLAARIAASIRRSVR
jgi:hypothetical protein